MNKRYAVILGAIFLAMGTSAKDNLSEKVLAHFKNDEMKYKAALFLLQNMDAHYSYASKGITSYYQEMDSVFSLPIQKDDMYKKAYVVASTRSGDLSENSQILWDKDAINSEQLISYVNDAFKMWQRSWNKDVSFEMFCEYVLPYRITTEPVSDWRILYMDKYRKTIEPHQNSQVNYTYKYGLYKELNKGFYGALYYPETYLPELPLDILQKMRLGNCESNAKRNIAQLRAMGLPATLDFVPQWGNRSMGHSWGVLLTDNNENGIPFGLNENLGIHFYFRPDHKLPKVFRHTFSKQPEMEEFASDEKSVVPEYLHNRCIKDVTDKYIEVSDVAVTLKAKTPKTSPWVYLCVFDDKDWIPVCFAKRSGSVANFKKMGRGIVYLPVSYDGQGNMIAEANPFILEADGKMVELNSNTSKVQMVRTIRKYNFTTNLKEFCKNTEGGKFQVANKEDFSDSITIASIAHTEESRFYNLKPKYKGKYQYFRYLAPDGSYGNMAEIEVYDSKGEKLTSKNMFGLRGAVRGHNLEKVFDGDPLTSYSLPFQNGGWAALGFEQPQSISEIRYLPRNDGNFIEESDLYALYYWDYNGWKLVEEKQGNREGILNFDKVPTGSLLLLRDLSKGSQERIFTYSNGKQIWW